MSSLENMFYTAMGRRCLIVLENPIDPLEVLVEYIKEGEDNDGDHLFCLKSDIKTIGWRSIMDRINKRLRAGDRIEDIDGQDGIIICRSSELRQYYYVRFNGGDRWVRRNEMKLIEVSS